MIGYPTKILQVNLNRSQQATESALQLALELKVDLLLVQEPWILQDSTTRSINHPSFTQLLPNFGEWRPRTLAYISRGYKPLVSLSPSSPQDPDLLVIDIKTKSSKFQVLNIYNEEDQAKEGPKTLERCLFLREIEPNSILLGDFNTHHPWWDPLARKSTNADDFVQWIEEKGLELINEPGIATFFRPNLVRESVLDLILATKPIAGIIEDWQVLRDIGSDHFGILFSIASPKDPQEEIHPREQFDIKQANWELFTNTLRSAFGTNTTLNSSEFHSLFTNKERAKGTLLSQLNSSEQNEGLLLSSSTRIKALLDKVASQFTEAILSAARASIPIRKPCSKSKPWWNEDLKKLRKEMLWLQRRILDPKDLQTTTPFLQARNSYFAAIKHAKREHWNHFLEKEDPQSIFKAVGYTKDRQAIQTPPIRDLSDRIQDTFEGKCTAFRTTLFPSPPISPPPNWENYSQAEEWQWPYLTKRELKEACSTKIKSKSPGPDSITQDIIIYAFKAAPEWFFRIFSSLIDIGYHPICWKQATGAILRKQGKRDDSIPKAYRVIALLNCLGKVSERILAKRLGYLAETTPLLHPTQIGGRQKKSAIDAALILLNEVETNKRIKRKTTTLFLDVKGAFDHVARNQLLKIFQKLRLPTPLITWVSSFLEKRLLRLSFDNQIEEFSSIEAGIPQGSPISPILFLIYIRDLFPTLSSSVKDLSYIDDISLSTSSTSLKRNVRILEREVKKLYKLAEDSAISFDLSKTELIHFTSGKEAKRTTLTLPNQEVVEPKEVVRWLGIWFDSKLSFKEHIAMRVSQAKSAFLRMSRLVNIERGLSPFAVRQLYLACITSISDFGSPVWWRGQAQLKKPLQALQNLAVRKILGVFKTAPILPMEVEAILAPPEVRLDASIRKYAFRLQKLSPSHPVNQGLACLETPEYTETPRKSPPKVQLQRIQDSVTDLGDLGSLERIQHFKFPPWEPELPFQIVASSLSKEDEARAHLSQLQEEANSSNTIRIYTDASSGTEGCRGIGVGLIAFASPSPNINSQQSTNLGDSQLVYDGELEGITQAVEFASSNSRPDRRFRVFTDNRGALLRLQSLLDTPGQACQLRILKAAKKIASEGASLDLNWVPGHKDIPGNEKADTLAKKASLKDPPYPQRMSYAYLGQKIKACTSAQWEESLRKSEKNPSTYSKLFQWRLGKSLIPKGTKREQASAFFQLKLGHGYFRAYLAKLGHSDSNRCSCGGKETPEHLLLSCRELRKQQRVLQEGLGSRASLKVLLHTKLGVERTLEFLKETKVATRKWLQERKDKEERERRGEEQEEEEE
jgi:ribonuclease HI